MTGDRYELIVQKWSLRDLALVWLLLFVVWTRHPLRSLECNGALAIRWQERRRRGDMAAHRRAMIREYDIADQSSVVIFSPTPKGGWHADEHWTTWAPSMGPDS